MVGVSCKVEQAGKSLMRKQRRLGHSWQRGSLVRLLSEQWVCWTYWKLLKASYRCRYQRQIGTQNRSLVLLCHWVDDLVASHASTTFTHTSSHFGCSIHLQDNCSRWCQHTIHRVKRSLWSVIVRHHLHGSRAKVY